MSDQENIEECRPCQIAAAVVTSLDVCNEYELDCDALRQRIESGALTEGEALEYIQSMKQDAPEEAVEVLNDICSLIGEAMEEG